MFICYECGHVFSDPKYYTEDRGEHFGTPVYENITGCPSCGGAFTETYRCDACGEWIDTYRYVEVNDQRYCENCYIIKNLGE